MNLLNFKNYAIIGLLLVALVQTLRLNNAQHARDSLQAKIDHAQAIYQQQQDRLKLTEKEAAQRQRESIARMDKIMGHPVPQDCQPLFDWMIHQAVRRDI